MKRLRLRGRIRRPTPEEIADLAAGLYMSLSPAEAEELAAIIDRSLMLFDSLDDLPQPRRELKYRERDPGYRPSSEEDPLNLFITKCYVRGARRGRLLGKRVGLKDSICLAGVPMTNGSRVMEGFVPDIDAAAVERLLEAGAVIVGKLNMDDFSFAATGETSAFGCPRNPVNPEYSAGGSSGGSGAAVAAGEVDLALGEDTGGSGRIPAAWCGVVSIKPTHGLVPIYGVAALDYTMDCLCPMARTVAEVALALEVIAGDDPRDPQWVRGPIRVAKYSRSLKGGVSGLKVGVIREAFQWDTADPQVSETVKEAVRGLEKKGASSQEVSLPLFRNARAIWTALTTHSITAMLESDGEGYGRGGYCNIGWQEAFGRARRSRSDDFPPLLKMVAIEGKYMMERYFSTYFSKAQNLRLALREEVDRLLKEYDVLALPTTPMPPYKLVEKASLREIGSRVAAAGRNTLPFNLTGHPALTIPCGTPGGLPTGLQLVAGHWRESLLLRVAHTWEESFQKGL